MPYFCWFKSPFPGWNFLLFRRFPFQIQGSWRILSHVSSQTRLLGRFRRRWDGPPWLSWLNSMSHSCHSYNYFSHSCYKEIGDEHTNLSILFSPPDILEPVEQWPDPEWLISKRGIPPYLRTCSFFITRNGIPCYCNRQFTQGVYKIQRIFSILPSFVSK